MIRASEARKAAREALSGKWKKAFLISLLYALFTFAVGFVIGLLGALSGILGGLLTIVEIVIAVGEKELWGKGIGHNAVLEALKVAFFDMRAEYVVAKIKKINKRSQNLFKSVGFKEAKELEREIEYHINMKAFITIAA